MAKKACCSRVERVHVARKAQDQRQPERGRVDVVGGLPEVHVIVRVDVLVLAFLVAERFEREVGDHLVRVHVGRGARAALDEVGHELVAHLAGDQPIARAAIASAIFGSRTPRSRLASAAAFLT